MPEHTKYEPVKELPEYVSWAAFVAASDAEMVWKKAKEYGSLQIFTLAISKGRYQPVDLEKALAALVALKLGRILAALEQDHLPTPDTWRDLCCYAMMARRVRTTGAWPA